MAEPVSLQEVLAVASSCDAFRQVELHQVWVPKMVSVLREVWQATQGVQGYPDAVQALRRLHREFEP